MLRATYGPVRATNGRLGVEPRGSGMGREGLESAHPRRLPRAPAKVRSQTDLPTLALARQPFLGQGLSDLVLRVLSD
jgi:hypothetical protein